MHDIFLFVLGYKIQCVAAALLTYKIISSKSIYGLSRDTQINFAVANIARCVWTFETRLIESSFTYLELLASTLLSLALVYLASFKYAHTTEMQAPKFLSSQVFIPIAFVLSFFFHPGDEWFSLQILVSFTMYLEAMGLIPQLWLMRKMYDVEPLTSHYVAMLVVSRACRMVFWGVLFWNGEHFFQLFLADILHSVFCADYMFIYFRRIKNGGKLIMAL